jgi:hypothetical protein
VRVSATFDRVVAVVLKLGIGWPVEPHLVEPGVLASAQITAFTGTSIHFAPQQDLALEEARSNSPVHQVLKQCHGIHIRARGSNDLIHKKAALFDGTTLRDGSAIGEYRAHAIRRMRSRSHNSKTRSKR